MGIVVVVSRETLDVERGQVWRVEAENPSVTAASSFKLGWTTGNKKVVVTSRIYESTFTKLRASLYERAFSGGSAGRLLNRDLSIVTGSPITAFSSVTSSATVSLGAPKTFGTTYPSAANGNARTAYIGGLLGIILKPNTSYIVDLVNQGAATGEIFTAFDVHSLENILNFYQLQ